MFKRIKNRILRYLVIAVYFIIILVCAIQLNFLWLFGYSPTKKDIVMPSVNISTELYTADSVLIGRYFDEDRNPIPFDSIPKSVTNALIATEDVRFYSHNGVDFFGLGSGIISTLKGDKRGASTITQQLAKNLYRTRYNKAGGLLTRLPVAGLVITKFKEWMTAYKLEQRYSKNQILEMYLNTVSFSNNAYGIETAAKRYFSKGANQLNQTEAAVLIGMLKGTTLYNPIRNPENAYVRKNTVLSQMYKGGFLKKEEYDKLVKEKIVLNTNSQDLNAGGDSYLRAAVAKWLEKWSEDNNYDIYTDGLKIYTTINSKLQKHAEEAVAKQMIELQQRLNNTWEGQEPWRDLSGKVIPNFLDNLAKKTPYYAFLSKKYANTPDSINYFLNKKKKIEVYNWKDGGKIQKDMSTMDSLKYYAMMLNAGMMSMDPYSGEIKAWVGGINHQYFKYDHVMQAKRQAGSTFKPFVYLAALESGMSPCDKITDKPVTIKIDKGDSVEVWEPKNADWNFSYREMSLRHAMARSINSVTVQLTDMVTPAKVVDAAHRCGITSKLNPVASVGLGPNDVSVFEMVNGYSTMMNHGERVSPLLVSKIEDHDGNVIATFQAERKQVVDKQDAWLMTYMLRGGMEEPGGTSQGLWEWDLFDKENEIGGKTGTSSEYVDGWYMGVTKDLVTGVWVGCDERSIHFKNSHSGEGSRTALPIFGVYMESVYKDKQLGYTQGKFPSPTVEITKSYKCETPRYSDPEPEQSDSTQVEEPADEGFIGPEEEGTEHPVERNHTEGADSGTSSVGSSSLEELGSQN
ncbi:penicillin-binding protein 1A [Sphingobacterium multivorum]|uniref:Penicillin-binding protein 1A n=3 Tax=Sphingobacterium TaxID=28453 RepID=A0A2X2JM30_SPHMU|nr:transglycosylase domain-containing protein [Sphingobacterium multivorum]QRQ62618.1 transglycosylase domain-containing protein [Sphingobacterium multivorum]SPZ93021.1 Penicillin-binding protein 1A [Sphingobacterium multivorum]